MAATIIQRPLGFILGTCVSATINEAYAGYATINKASHGLVDGDYVYITSNIEDYNGFWYVNQEDTGKFKIRQYATADDVAYVQDATITYCPVTSTHGYNCVHLPITYRLRSDLYPTNEVDTSRTVSSFGDDLGYVNLNLSGSLDSGAYPEPFEYIKLGDDVYQILEVVSATSITINLAYDADLLIVGETVIRYYNNYAIKVRIYSGLASDHAWVVKKPFELVATEDYVPDENNEVFFSINKLLKDKIKIENNLALSTLPNNIDAFTQFYISIAESYDDSLGSNYRLSSYTSDYASDAETFTGVAVNAKLPFKSQHSGSLSGYVALNDEAKFLNQLPVFFDTNYAEVSFINPYDDTALTLRKIYSLAGVEVTTVNTALGSPDKGVIRAEVAIDCDLYDSVVVQVLTGSDERTEQKTFDIDCECDRQDIQIMWLNHLGGFDSFVFTADKDYIIDVEETGVKDKNIFPTWPNSYGTFADTVRKQTFRKTSESILVRSQYVKSTYIDALKTIKTSPLVQIITSRTDRRTVLVDSDSFTYKKDGQDLYDISFTVTYTDNIPSQE